jgi:hypothetical protein
MVAEDQRYPPYQGAGLYGSDQEVWNLCPFSAQDRNKLTLCSYATNVASTIAKYQITNGGPIILYQPENEYTGFANGYSFDPQYMQDVMNTARAAGIVIPFINNDASADGHDAPESGVGAVDIYGHDSYP